MIKILILVFASAFLALPLQAQPVAQDPAAAAVTELGNPLASQMDDFDYIKAEIGRLLVENKKLEAEYQGLKQQIDTLKSQVNAKEREWEKTAPKEAEATRSRERQLNSLKALYGDMEKLKNDITLKKSRTAFLSTKLLDLEEKQRLWKLKQSDLEYLKRELELDIKLMEYELSARKQERDDAVNKLRRKIEENLEREREILSRISRAEDGTLYSAESAIALLEENDHLALRINELSNEIEFQQRENDILQEKKTLAGKSKGHLLDKRLEEKEQLQQELEQLRQQVDELNLSLERSLKERSQKEAILKDFVSLQQQNEKLRTQVADMQAKLTGDAF